MQFFNGFAHNSCAAGEQRPLTSVIISSNCTFSTSERYIYTLISISITINSFLTCLWCHFVTLEQILCYTEFSS